MTHSSAPTAKLGYRFKGVVQSEIKAPLHRVTETCKIGNRDKPFSRKKLAEKIKMRADVFARA